MPDPRSWHQDDDELLARMDRHHTRLALGQVVSLLAPMLGSDPCQRHATIEECCGARAVALLGQMGLEVMPSDLLDVADEALAAAVDGDRVVVIRARPTMFDLRVVPN